VDLTFEKDFLGYRNVSTWPHSPLTENWRSRRHGSTSRVSLRAKSNANSHLTAERSHERHLFHTTCCILYFSHSTASGLSRLGLTCRNDPTSTFEKIAGKQRNATLSSYAMFKTGSTWKNDNVHMLLFGIKLKTEQHQMRLAALAIPCTAACKREVLKTKHKQNRRMAFPARFCCISRQVLLVTNCVAWPAERDVFVQSCFFSVIFRSFIKSFWNDRKNYINSVRMPFSVLQKFPKNKIGQSFKDISHKWPKCLSEKYKFCLITAL